MRSRFHLCLSKILIQKRDLLRARQQQQCGDAKPDQQGIKDSLLCHVSTPKSLRTMAHVTPGGKNHAAVEMAK